jgi:putative acetyltransferase
MVTVREAREADAEAILDLHIASIRAFGPETYDDEQVEAWAYKEGGPSYPIGHPEHVVLVAERAGEIAGFGDIAPPECELYAVYVHPEHAGEGVGTAILDLLERTASDHGCDRLELTASKNAVGFYAQAGYERIEAVDHEPSGPHDVTLKCVRMRKSPTHGSE